MNKQKRSNLTLGFVLAGLMLALLVTAMVYRKVGDHAPLVPNALPPATDANDQTR